LPLNEAIANRNAFPIYLVDMIKIAENTGRLGETFEQLSGYYDQNDQLRQKIKNALTYPFVLIGLMSVVILMLILKVLPIFHEILLSVGGSVPKATAFVLDLSLILQNGILFLLGILVLVVLYFMLLFKTNILSKQRDAFLLNFPGVKAIYRKSLAVKFSRAYAILIKSGMPLVEGLELIIPLMENESVEKALKGVAQAVQEGKSLSDALSNTQLFPDLFVKMIELGSKTGALDVMLDKTADIYERELNRSLHRLTVSIEPTLVIILSLIVGAILLLVMLPLINIMSSIG
jgi:type IV pilus assembly protein PilC